MVAALLERLEGRNIRITLEGERLRVDFHPDQPLIDEDRENIREHRSEIIAFLMAGEQTGALETQAPANAPSPYPNASGLAKCNYCALWADTRCTASHQPYGISLLRRCAEFRFDPGKYDNRPPDMKIVRLDEALLAFAMNAIRKAATVAELTATWSKHGHHWKRRLDPAAWKSVEAEYREQVKVLTASRRSA
jgi:hypothetical protein